MTVDDNTEENRSWAQMLMDTATTVVVLREESQKIIEIIMTQHWDMQACPCWICKAGRDLGFHPRQDYQAWSHPEMARPKVMVDMCMCRNIKAPVVYTHVKGCPHFPTGGAA